MVVLKKEGEMAISHCSHSLALSGEAIKQLELGQILTALRILNLARHTSDSTDSAVESVPI